MRARNQQIDAQGTQRRRPLTYSVFPPVGETKLRVFKSSWFALEQKSRTFILSREGDARLPSGCRLTYLYLTEQPYGFVLDVLTDLPAMDSSSATFT
jgi:hypothetical protein